MAISSLWKETRRRNWPKRSLELIEAGTQGPDVASLFASIEKINHRLEKLETAVEMPRPEQNIPSSSHPSLDKFAIAEAIVDSLFEKHSKEKACTFEPSKPCDHCSMCIPVGSKIREDLQCVPVAVLLVPLSGVANWHQTRGTFVAPSSALNRHFFLKSHQTRGNYSRKRVSGSVVGPTTDLL